MTVSTTDNRIPYSGNGVTTAFDFPYKFLSTGDLKVYVDDVLMTLTTDYSVGTPSDDGATVTFVVAPAAGTNNIVILRDPDLLQQSALPSNGPFPSTSVETMVDKVTLQVQRLKELVTRSFRLSDADATGASTVLPTPEALKVIGWSNDGLSLVNTDASTLATVVTAGNPIYEFFDGDAVTTEFTVASSTLGSLPATKVFISGVRQSPGVDYTISDATVTFTVAPPSGTGNILVEWTDAIAAVGVPSDGSITLAKLVDGLFTVTSTALSKFADGFFSATAEARAKFADGFVNAAKISDTAFSELITVTLDPSADFAVISDTSDGGKKKKALIPSSTVTSASGDPTYVSTSDTNPATPAWVNGRLIARVFTSADQTMTAGGLLTIAHGLGSVPKRVFIQLKCTTADGVYALNDIIEVAGVDEGSAQSAGITVRKDATNIYVRVGTGGFILLNNSGAVYNITLANYRLIAKAEL